jgi:hypothetical protein
MKVHHLVIIHSRRSTDMALAGGRARMGWHRPGEILYRDAVSRGPSRLPSQRLSTRATTPPSEMVETIPSNGLRSLLYNRRLPVLYAEKARTAMSNRSSTAGKFATPHPYTERHKFPGYAALLELFDRGCIVEAMTRFYLASRSWALVYNGKIDAEESEYEVSPHIVHDIMERLARTATMSAVEWQGFVQTTPRENCWIPRHSSSSVDLRQMEVPTLAFHALVDVFDMGGAVGIMPDDTAMASIFHAFSYHLDVHSFTKSVHLTLLRLSGLSLDEARVEFARKRRTEPPPKAFKSLPRVAVRAIIEGYGRMGAPQVGEALLREWSLHISKEKEQTGTEIRRAETVWYSAYDRSETSAAPVSVDSSGWAGDANIWLALIRSRGSTFDLAGARHWLYKYREEGLSAVRSTLGGYKCGQPHIAYLSALSQFRPKEARATHATKEKPRYLEDGKTRYQSIVDTIQLMLQDGAAMTEKTFITCINLHLGFKKLNEAASMIKLLLQSKDMLVVRRPSFYRIFFHLHRSVHSRLSIDADQVQMLARQGPDGSTNYLANLRALFRDFWSTFTAEETSWSRKDMLETLTEGLRASFATHDFPLASVTLSTLRKLGYASNDQLFAIVTTGLDDETTEKRPGKIEKASNHQKALTANMRAWLKAKDSEGITHEEITFKSAYFEDPHRHQKVLDSLIRIVNSRIVKDVLGGLQCLGESDPAWLHTACLALKKRKINSHNDIVKHTTSPILDGLREKRGRVKEKDK